MTEHIESGPRGMPKATGENSDIDLSKSALSRRGAEIAARLERLPASRFNWIVLSVGALAFLVEAIDTSIIAAVLEPIQTSLGLTPAQVGSLSVAAILTTVIGVLLVGPLADKFGRKRMLVVGIIVAEIFTMLTYFASDFPTLMTYRLITGLGLGFIFPVTLTFVAEFVGSKERGYFTGLCNSVLGLGYFLSLLISYVIVPRYGYHATFLVPGLLLPAIPYVILAMPESPRWLATHGKIEEAEKIVAGIEARVQNWTGSPLPPPKVIVMPEQTGRIRDLFGKTYLRTTLVLWLMLSMTFVVFYTRLLYMPLILTQNGIDLKNSLLLAGVMNAVAIPGNIGGGLLMNIIGRRWTVASYGVLTGVFALAFATTSSPLLLFIFGCGIFWFDTFAAQKMLINESYATPVRATGASSAEFVARSIGGILWAWSVPSLLVLWGPHLLFVVIGVAAMILIPLAGLAARETRGQVL
jgi:putative MFS transporter